MTKTTSSPGKVEVGAQSQTASLEMKSSLKVVEGTPLLADPFTKREGRDLIWKDLNMTLAASGDEPKRKLLDGVWGEVPRRQVTAIMGPSGSGKTSLLNVLAGRIKTGGRLLVEEDCRLNNYSVDPTDILVRKKIAFVAQDDSLQVTSTPREAIRFSAKLRLPASISEDDIDALTEHMLQELGLLNCADTIVGGALIKGISGGERKRTSVGVELVTRPALVFLDEPTSGLDSFNAIQLCQLLKKIANAGSSVLFTIHQPSSEIFSSFDRLILMNRGRVMYQGAVADIPSYFEARGHPSPPNYNPADWILNVALSNSIEELDSAGYFPEDNRDIGEAFVADGSDGKDALGITVRNAVTDDSRVSFLVQTKMLFQREVTNTVRATHAIKARIAMTTVNSTLIGLIFYQVAVDTDFSKFINVQTTFGACLMLMMANIFAVVIPSLMSIPEERPVFLREYSTDHYSALAYFISRLAMELIVTGVQVTLSIIIIYFLVGYTAHFGTLWAASYLMACSSTALGVLVGCSVENPSVAIEFMGPIFMPQILFAGFFVPPDLIPNWLAWIRFICPLTYGAAIVASTEFGEGSRCEGLEPNYCSQVLENAKYEEDDIWWYFLVLLGLFIFVRILALIQLKRRADKFY